MISTKPLPIQKAYSKYRQNEEVILRVALVTVLLLSIIGFSLC